MTTENEIYFGDQNTFAIRYVPGYSDVNKKYFYAYCHLVLGRQIIGKKEEPFFLSSWKFSLENLKDQLKNDFNTISHAEFNNRSDKELFELIWKANQPEDEYKLAFAHLPVLDSKVWSNCHISIDETTDAFLIAMTEFNGDIKFLWQGWREPCSADKIGKLYSTIVSKQFIIETMERCLETIEMEYLTYPTKE